MNKKIIFSGFMAAILLSASANAAQIASKDYVDAQNTAQTTSILNTVNTTLEDYSTTSEINTTINQIVEGAIDDAVDAVNSDVANKADKKVPATAGNLAGLDATGNLADSGISATGLQTSITNLGDAVTAIEGDITTIEGDITTMGDTLTTLQTTIVDADLSNLATKTEVTTGLAGKADASTTYSKTEVDTALDAKADASDLDALATVTSVNAALAGKEDLSNKSNSIATDTGSTTKYTTVNAVEAYALPKPPADCATAQCVLSVNSSGNPFWEVVTLVTP